MSKPGDQLQPLDQLSFHRQKRQIQNVFKEGTDFAGMQLHPKLAATMHGALPESNFSRISKSTKDDFTLETIAVRRNHANTRQISQLNCRSKLCFLQMQKVTPSSLLDLPVFLRFYFACSSHWSFKHSHVGFSKLHRIRSQETLPWEGWLVWVHPAIGSKSRSPSLCQYSNGSHGNQSIFLGHTEPWDSTSYW